MSRLILVRALWKIRRKTPPNLPPTSRTPVVFTFRGVRIVRKRHAPKSRHDFAVKAKTNVCRVELRWTDQRRVAVPDGVQPVLRARQQRHAAFAPSLRGHNNVIDAEVWRKTAWVKLLVQGRSDRPSTRKSMFMPCYTLCASTPCDSVGWAYALEFTARTTALITTRLSSSGFNRYSIAKLL